MRHLVLLVVLLGLMAMVFSFYRDNKISHKLVTIASVPNFHKVASIVFYDNTLFIGGSFTPEIEWIKKDIIEILKLQKAYLIKYDISNKDGQIVFEGKGSVDKLEIINDHIYCLIKRYYGSNQYDSHVIAIDPSMLETISLNMPSSSISGFAFADQKKGYIWSNNDIFYTNDGGVSWNLIGSNILRGNIVGGSLNQNGSLIVFDNYEIKKISADFENTMLESKNIIVSVLNDKDENLWSVIKVENNFDLVKNNKVITSFKGSVLKGFFDEGNRLILFTSIPNDKGIYMHLFDKGKDKLRSCKIREISVMESASFSDNQIIFYGGAGQISSLVLEP